MKDITWIITLSLTEMKIFDFDEENGSALKFLESVSNELVGLKGKEMAGHKPGLVAEGGRGVARYVLTGHQDPREIANDAFVLHVAKFLDSERRHCRFSKLIVAAEPRFLGRFKKCLNAETLKSIIGWIPKDLEKLSTEDIAERVRQKIQVMSQTSPT